MRKEREGGKGGEGNHKIRRTGRPERAHRRSADLHLYPTRHHRLFRLHLHDHRKGKRVMNQLRAYLLCAASVHLGTPKNGRKSSNAICSPLPDSSRPPNSRMNRQAQAAVVQASVVLSLSLSHCRACASCPVSKRAAAAVARTTEERGRSVRARPSAPPSSN